MEDLKKLLAAATPGPWWIASMNPNVVSAGARNVLRCYKIADARGTTPSANAALICAAVNALPELLAMAEENARLREALKRAEEIAALIDHVEFYTAESAMGDLQTIRFIARAALKETGQ